MKCHLAQKLTKLPEGINDRLMRLQLPLPNKKFATLVSAYAPTMTNPDDIKDKFYEELDDIIAGTPKAEKLIVLGDFNARVGTDHQCWDGVIGRHGIGKCNSNGLLLLKTCAAHDLAVTNTMFRLPTHKKTTWMHPRSGHWHLIDYVITKKRDIADVRVTRAMRGANCWTDHRLVVSKLKLHIAPKRRPQGQKTAKRLNIAKLKDPTVLANFSDELEGRLTDLKVDDNTSVENQWSALRDTIHSTAINHLGPVTKRNQDWFNENDNEIEELLKVKHRTYKAHLDDPSSTSKRDAYTNAKRKVQQQLRNMQDTWFNKKAEEIQHFADIKDSKRFYDSIKALHGPQVATSCPLLNADGTQLLTEKKHILDRWAEHFDKVLNRPAEINNEAIAQLPQVPMNTDLDQVPTESEIRKAIRQLSRGKAPGSDAIPAEVYKTESPALIHHLVELLNSIWKSEQVPQQLKDASIIHIYKRKGNRQSCDNHRGISLLSIAGKILARILLNRLLKHLEQGLLPESQCGFRAKRGTADMVFAARQLQEKCQEQHRDLFATYVDLTKAFDTVSREGLWKIMNKFGCPDKFTTIVRQLHDGMMAKVTDSGDESDAFQVTNGVKQGCVLAPTLFSMVFSAMLLDAFKDSEDEIIVKYRTDGKLFNSRRLQAVTKVHKVPIRDFLFADDCALNAFTEKQMQLDVDSFSMACDNFGLTISTKKTEVMFQPAPGKPYYKPHISVNNHELQVVENFTYLGSTLSQDVSLDAEINNRIAKASAAFGRLTKNVWERKGLKLSTKIKVYMAVVLTTLLYASETWTAYSRHIKKINHFHMCCLRRLLHIRWQDKVPDTKVLELSGQSSIHTILMKNQARWAGHLVRMPNCRLPKQLLYGELTEGTRPRGRPKKRFKDCLKTSLKSLSIDLNTWEQQALDRTTWRNSIKKGASTAEASRNERLTQKREARKARTTETTPTDTPHVCPTCGRVCRARIGLLSHMKTHKTHNT